MTPESSQPDSLDQLFAEQWDNPNIRQPRLDYARQAVSRWAEHQPSVPTDFSRSVVRLALHDRQRRQRERRLLRVGIGLVLLIGVGFIVQRRNDSQIGVVPIPREVANRMEPTISTQPIAEARAAWHNLKQSTTEAWRESLDHWPNSNLSRPKLGTTVEPIQLSEAYPTLTRLPQSARETVAPVTDSARRAWRVFLRDTGLDTEPHAQQNQ